MTGSRVRIYTRCWCEDSQAAKQFLSERGIPFDEIDIEENPEACQFVMSVNDGKQRTPTFEVDGRAFHSSPFDARELMRELQLQAG